MTIEMKDVYGEVIYYTTQASKDDFIAWVKKTRYDINAVTRNPIYNDIISKIKERLDREGLAYDVVKND
jgi:hypothetical protein